MDNAFNTLDRKMSLWEAANRWTGHDIEVLRYADTPVPKVVADAAYSLMKGQINGDMNFFDEDGYEAFSNGETGRAYEFDDSLEEFPMKQKLFEFGAVSYDRHEQSVKKQFVDAAHLESVFLQIDQFGLWALKAGAPFPYFCLTESQKEILLKRQKLENENNQSPEGKLKVNQEIADRFWKRLSHSQRSRLMSRSIASDLWKNDNTLTIAEIERHDAIQNFAGGKHYSDKDTIRNWIKDLDPRDPATKAGRPSKTK
jgi:hypothetical protein